jgi:predicted membrane protein (TIGR00267 family)
MPGFFAKNRLDLVAGLCDGILTALILAGGSLFHPESSMGLGLCLRVAVAAAASGAFIFFVAHYAELRSELVHAERQLNLLSPGRFAATRLGRTILRESFVGAMIASICTFIGALIPILASMIPAAPSWLGAVIAIAALGLLGLFLGRAVYGNPTRWALGLAVAGVIVAYIGMKLNIV